MNDNDLLSRQGNVVDPWPIKGISHITYPISYIHKEVDLRGSGQVLAVVRKVF